MKLPLPKLTGKKYPWKATEWDKSFTTPNARYGHTITRIGTKIFVIGGQNSHDNHNDIWLVDTGNTQGITINN